MEKIIYAKLSNDRDEKFHIQTLIVENEEGRKVVKKPDSLLAVSHVKALEVYCRQLSRQFTGSRFEVNQCHMEGESAVLEYINGSSLEEIADQFLIRGKKEQTISLLLDVAEQIRSVNSVPFEKSARFEEVFGSLNTAAIEGKPCGVLADVDLILHNILVRDGKWVIIDYEWTFDFPIPTSFVVYRMLRYYVQATALRQQMDLQQLCGTAGISEEEICCFAQMEEAFQNYVDGTHMPLRKLYNRMGKKVIDAQECCSRETLSMQVFYDRGNGCTEEDSYRILPTQDGAEFDIVVAIPEDAKMVRIDPMDDAGIVIVRTLRFKNADKEVKYKSNGKKFSDSLILFAEDDPMLLIPCAGQKELNVRLRAEKMSKETVGALAAMEIPKEKKGFFGK